MNSLYSENIKFEDPIFGVIESWKPKAMWQMLCEKSGDDFEVRFGNIKEDGNKGSCDWEALYTFAKTGNKIHNKIHAEFTFQDGKIIDHKDTFSLYKWAGMALGIKGYLLGFLPSVKASIQKEVVTGFDLFVKRKKLAPK